MATGDSGDITDVVERFAQTEERNATCVAQREGCEENFIQRRSMTMKGRAWSAAICQSCQRQLDENVAQRELEEQRAQGAQRNLEVLEVPPLYAEAEIANFMPHGGTDNEKRISKIAAGAARYVQRWPNVPGIAVFMGDNGTGKTHLAWAIAKDVVRMHGNTTKVVVLPDLIRELREGWSHPAADPESYVLERYRDPALLVVDEVSRHAYYGEPTQHLYHLINHRMNWLRPTILTTNETIEGLAESLGSALMSRITGEKAIWDFGNVDHRQEKPSWLES